METVAWGLCCSGCLLLYLCILPRCPFLNNQIFSILRSGTSPSFLSWFWQTTGFGVEAAGKNITLIFVEAQIQGNKPMMSALESKNRNRLKPKRFHSLPFTGPITC